MNRFKSIITLAVAVIIGVLVYTNEYIVTTIKFLDVTPRDLIIVICTLVICSVVISKWRYSDNWY